MAGQYPPPPPPPGRPPASPYGRPPYGPPGHGPPVYGPPPGRPPGWFPGRPAGPPSPYRYVPVRPPRRRSAGGTIAGIFGALTSLAVVAILGATFLVEQSGASTARPPVTSGGGGGAAREQALNSRLYRTGPLTPVNCRVPGIQPSTHSMRRFMNVLSDCLDRSWSRQFGKARHQVPRTRPRVLGPARTQPLRLLPGAGRVRVLLPRQRHDVRGGAARRGDVRRGAAVQLGGVRAGHRARVRPPRAEPRRDPALREPADGHPRHRPPQRGEPPHRTAGAVLRRGVPGRGARHASDDAASSSTP